MAEESTLRRAAGDHDVWFFGYGSLMWRAGFAFEEARHAKMIRDLMVQQVRSAARVS